MQTTKLANMNRAWHLTGAIVLVFLLVTWFHHMSANFVTEIRHISDTVSLLEIQQVGLNTTPR